MQYAQKRFISGLFCILLVSVILFNSYEKRVYADAGTIAVAGGSVAVGGLGAGALAGLGGPVVIAVILAGMAFGVNVELTKASEQAGLTKTEFVQSKISQYCNEAQITLGIFNDAILNGMTVLNDGRIKLTNQASLQIKQFYNWLFENDMVEEINPSANLPHVTLAGNNFPVLRAGDSIELWSSNGTTHTFQYVSGNIDIAVFCRGYSPGSGNYQFVFFTSEALANQYGTVINISYDGVTSQFDLWDWGNTYRYNNIGTGDNYSPVVLNDQIPYLGTAFTSGIFNSFDQSFNVESMDNPITNDTFTGDKDEYDVKSPVLNPEADKTTVLNPGVIGSIGVPADKDYTIDVNSYLEAIQKILDKINDITIPAVDDATGIPDELEIDETDVLDPTIEKEDDTDLPSEDDQTPIINDNPIDPSNDPVLAADPLKFDLRNIFPFCIPFDIKDMLSKLSADPVAPSYTVNWHIPIVNTNLVFTVDLSSFDNVASILRNMELIAFIIGLAFITRSLIRG